MCPCTYAVTCQGISFPTPYIHLEQKLQIEYVIKIFAYTDCSSNTFILWLNEIHLQYLPVGKWFQSANSKVIEDGEREMTFRFCNALMWNVLIGTKLKFYQLFYSLKIDFLAFKQQEQYFVIVIMCQVDDCLPYKILHLFLFSDCFL